METTNKKRKNRFLALCLSAMMLSSAGAVLASCTDAATDSSSVDSSSSESTSQVKDEGLVKNSGFETFDKNDNKNVIGTSVTGWSRSLNSPSSGTAASSKAASGIIDTSEEGWKYLTGSNFVSKDEVKALSDAQAIAQWDNFTAGDKLAFYDAWKKRNPNGKIAEDFEKYESLNIDEGDIPGVQNPGTHYAADDTENKDKTNILMIHNENPDPTSTSATYKALGTAQKYTSSSTVTVPAGASAEFSVWVKTAELQTTSTSGDAQDAVGKGAYISVTHSVGGKSLDAYEVKNIDTESMSGLEGTNGWKQYTFYLKGASYADTTFSIVLGLGQSGNTDRHEYVNGYAFFDDLKCEIITNEDYDAKAGASDVLAAVDFVSEKEDKIVDTYVNTTASKFALNFYGSIWGDESILDNATLTPSKTESSVGLNTNNEFDVTFDRTTVYANRAAIKADIDANTATNKYLDIVYNEFLGDVNGDEKIFADNQPILMLLSSGTAYTVESSQVFTLDKDTDYMAVSFFVKTSDLEGGTGAGITLTETGNLVETAFTAIDTSALKGVTIGETENVYDGWQQCFFFIQKAEDVDTASFTLSFNYGPTDITTSTTKESFATGFAAFTGFTSHKMSKQEYESAQSGTYAKLVTLTGATADEAVGNSGFDSAAGVPSDALETGLANLANYKGVYSDSYRVSLPSASDSEDVQNEKRKINAYENAGLLNRENFTDELVTSNAGKAWLEGLKTISSSSDATSIWNRVFGVETTQPLFIWNDSSATKSYGFISSTSTAISNEYTSVSLRVKTGGGAKASVYLIDADDTTYQSVLSIDREQIYWYDENGNICTGDPTEKDTQVAFELQSNGLYLASSAWSGYESLGENKTKYFANLANYEANADGDLIVAENGSSYDYYDHTWDRQAFYLHEGNYYTEDNGAGELVLDLATYATALSPRYAKESGRQLMFENIDTNGEWATVTFYIRKGDETKNYRLEVWSGTRSVIGADGNATTAVANTTGYVIFDTNNPGDATTNYTALLDVYKEMDDVEQFESVFSYYDSDRFLRYDESLDTDKIGNVYAESFTPGESGIAYLIYNKNNRYDVFADYTLSEVTVSPQIESDDTTSDSSSEDTAPDDTTNVWLLASSISVAAVLLLAVLSIVIRKVVQNIRKKRGVKTRAAAPKAKKEKPAKKAEKSQDKDSPYND